MLEQRSVLVRRQCKETPRLRVIEGEAFRGECLFQDFVWVHSFGCNETRTCCQALSEVSLIGAVAGLGSRPAWARFGDAHALVRHGVLALGLSHRGVTGCVLGRRDACNAIAGFRLGGDALGHGNLGAAVQEPAEVGPEGHAALFGRRGLAGFRRISGRGRGW